MKIRSAQAIGSVAAATMVIAIVSGMVSGNFVDELRGLVQTPWGRVILIDLMIGLLVAGAWIGWREASAARAAPWWIAILLTGNLAVGIYLIKAAWTARSMEELLTGNRA